MKSLWKQSGLACADAGPISPLGGRSRHRARLTVYVFAVAFAALTAYVAFTAAPAAAGGGGGAAAGGSASWFGGVYASTAPYRSQISSLFSSVFPGNSSAPSPQPSSRAASGSGGGGGGEVNRDETSGQVGSAEGGNKSAAAESSKQLGSGGGAPISNAGGGSAPPASDLAGAGNGGSDGGGAPTNNSTSSGRAPNGAADRDKASNGGGSSPQAGGGSGSPASSSAGNGTAAAAGEEGTDISNQQSGSGSGAPSNGAAGHGSTAKAGAVDTAGAPSSNSAGSGSSVKSDLSTGSSSNHTGSGSGVLSSGSAAGSSSAKEADAKGSVGAVSNGSSGSATDMKVDLNNNSSDAPTVSGSGDASHESAANSSPSKSSTVNGGVDLSNSSGSIAPASDQAENLAMARGKGGEPPSKNNTFVASPPPAPAVKNQEQASSGFAADGTGGTTNNQQKGEASQGSAGSSKSHSVHTADSKSGNNGNAHESSTNQASGSSGNKKADWFREMASCDMFDGNWVQDDSYPLYPEGSCPHIDEPFNCYLNGRRDLAYQKLRWQPRGCSIPRLNPTDMLERLRGKRLVFVGDSLNRNMWESLVCILRNSVKDKRKVFEASGRHEFKSEGSYSFVFTDYNCSVEFFRSPFLVQEWEMQVSDGKKKETLRLDLVEQSSPKYKDADFLIFNTGHWWTHEKTSLGKDYYQEGSHVYSELNVVDAFHKALITWSRWIDANVNPRKTVVLFRGYSASHFSGGQWNSGGSCDKESQPITNEQYLSAYPLTMSILEDVIHKMKTPVVYLNITRMSDYRKDAHPSIYRKQNLTDEERRSPERYQDCSHWCLPGVPDSWNELVYAQILIKQHQMLQQ
ncbi:hypothetical protein ACP4OV_016912 [Aristida adscensionis]